MMRRSYNDCAFFIFVVLKCNINKMVQLNILYPKNEEATFDWDYYLHTHMPLSIKLQGEALKSVSISKGLEDIPGALVKFIASAIMLYESVNAFMEAFMPHADVLQGDMKNYTNVQPIIQFNEVMMEK